MNEFMGWSSNRTSEHEHWMPELLLWKSRRGARGEFEWRSGHFVISPSACPTIVFSLGRRTSESSIRNLCKHGRTTKDVLETCENEALETHSGLLVLDVFLPQADKQ